MLVYRRVIAELLLILVMINIISTIGTIHVNNPGEFHTLRFEVPLIDEWFIMGHPLEMDTPHAGGLEDWKV